MDYIERLKRIDYHNKLRQLRLERNISQDYIASRLGRSKQWVHRVENGDADIRTERELFRYIEVLNSDMDVDPVLPLIHEDGDLTVEFASMEDALGKGKILDGVTAGRAIKVMLSRRVKDEGRRSLYNKRYYLVPYLVELEPQTDTSPHTHPPSVETGIVLSGEAQLFVGVDEYGACIDSFRRVDMTVGESYTISSAVPHYVCNASSEKTLILVIRLNISPFYITKPSERKLTTVPEDFPVRSLISEVNSRSLRVIEAQLDPYPHRGIRYHRHSWSEELIVVTKGELQVILRSRLEDSGDHEYKEFNLRAPSSIHMDGRIEHSVRNPSNTEEVRYIVVHRFDLEDFNETYVQWQNRDL